MDLSIVASLYRSEEYIPEFCSRIIAAAEEIGDEFELILVNDGSPDNSQSVAQAICERDVRVRLIELSRNFGHHKAVMTGLQAARGARVFCIDADLEEPPELLRQFDETMRTTGADVVYGVQDSRKGGLFERVSGSLFYTLFNLLSSHPIPKNSVSARLMTRAYVDGLVQHRDVEAFLPGLYTITGFRQLAVTVHKSSRGKTSYTLTRRVALLVNAITSFSIRPLIIIFAIGWAIVLLSAVWGGYLIARRLFFGELLPGFASLMVSIWFLGGLTIFWLGLIGIYLAKIHAEVKRRPYTIIRSRYGKFDETFPDDSVSSVDARRGP